MRRNGRWRRSLACACTKAGLLFALVAPAAAQLCDGDDPWLSEDVLLILREDVGDSAAAIEELLGAFPQLSLPPDTRRIPELRAWLLKADAPSDQLLRDVDDYRNAGGRRLVDKAEFHYGFETPEGGQRDFPDLTRSPTIDDFLTQSAATIIRAQPTGRRWTGAGITVAIVDTAATLDHPVTSGFVQGPGLDTISGEGTAQVSANGLDDDGDGDVDESMEHGTFVAGLVHLAAPEAELLHVRVLDDDGHGDAFDIAQGIVDSVQAGADVINLSLGGTTGLRIITEAVDWALSRNVVVVAAAGNRGSLCLDQPASQADPLEGDAVIAVAAVDDSLAPAAFTNHSPGVSLGAPGVDVISTFQENFGNWSGTSFSAPLVAGGAAVLLQKYPGLAPADVKTALMATSQPYPAPAPTDMGAGVLDLGLVQDHLGAFRDSLRLFETGGGLAASWSPVLDAATYDLLRGEIRNLRRSGGTVDLGPMTCIRDDFPGAPEAELLGDADPVPPGGFFYLLRDDAPDGGATGSSSLGEPRVPAATDCP